MSFIAKKALTQHPVTVYLYYIMPSLYGHIDDRPLPANKLESCKIGTPQYGHACLAIHACPSSPTHTYIMTMSTQSHVNKLPNLSDDS